MTETRVQAFKDLVLPTMPAEIPLDLKEYLRGVEGILSDFFKGDFFVTGNLYVKGKLFSEFGTVPPDGDYTYVETLKIDAMTGILKAASGVVAPITTSAAVASIIQDEVGSGYMLFGDQSVRSNASPSFVRLTVTEPTLSPFVITSQVVNTNLNADLLDGQHGSYYAPAVAGGYVPYVGATTNVDLGVWGITSGSVKATGSGLIWSDGTTGTTPTSGAGTRMMWIPDKWAFRAGRVGGVEWNVANIGNYSVAFGRDSIASGNYSAAFGYSSTAGGGDYSIASGGSTASGEYSSAFGVSVASGNYSVAFGRGEATNIFSLCSGFGTASGEYSSSLGYSHANSNHSFAAGYFANSNGIGAIAIGENANVDNTSFIAGDAAADYGAIAIGYASAGKTLQATGVASVAIGQDVSATGDNSFALGLNFTNTAGFAVGYNAIDFKVTSGVVLINGILKILETGSTPTYYTIFQGGDQIADITYTLPTALPTSDKYLKCTSGGVLSWDTPAGGGTPGGADTNVQYNDGGAFGGEAAFTYNKTTDVLTVPTINLTTAAALIQDNGTTVLSTSGTANLIIGYQAFLNDLGSYNVGLGYQAGYNNDTTGGGTKGQYNFYMGYKCGYGSTSGTKNTGDRNVGIGSQALYYNTDGRYNMALGYRVLYTNVGGDFNTGIGSESLYYNTSGEGNVGIGVYAGYYNATGSYSICIGNNAGKGASGNSFSRDIFIGPYSGYTITTGSYNIAIGYYAGGSLTTGASNIFIGYYAGYRQDTLPDLLIIDNRQRADKDTERTNAILYGVMAAAPADQTLRINAALNLCSAASGFVIIGGSTTSKTLTVDQSITASTVNKRCILVHLVNGGTDVVAGDGKAYFMIPETMNGMNLTRAICAVVVHGHSTSTEIVKVDIYNVTDSVDMLSAATHVHDGNTIGDAGTIDTGHDDVATNDVIRFDITEAFTGTAAKGLMVTLEFSQP